MKNTKKNSFTHEELHKQWMKDPEYVREYEKLELEFQIARAMIGARLKMKLSQKELAEKVGTGQAVISRLENMNHKPSLALVEKVADALGLKPQLRFVPK